MNLKNRSIYSKDGIRKRVNNKSKVKRVGLKVLVTLCSIDFANNKLQLLNFRVCSLGRHAIG